MFLVGESAFMTSFTSAVTGAGRKLNNYDFDLRVRASRRPTVRWCSSTRRACLS
ncbi:MAG: hypothetical protein ACLTBF_11630 [Christensenellales bacterium]